MSSRCLSVGEASGGTNRANHGCHGCHGCHAGFPMEVEVENGSPAWYRLRASGLAAYLVAAIAGHSSPLFHRPIL
jgi:hypothetical protein